MKQQLCLAELFDGGDREVVGFIRRVLPIQPDRVQEVGDALDRETGLEVIASGNGARSGIGDTVTGLTG